MPEFTQDYEPSVSEFKTLGAIQGDDQYGLELSGITFTGKHDVATKTGEIEVGLIVESTGEIWMGDSIDCALPYVIKSDTKNSKTVFGVTCKNKFDSMRYMMLKEGDLPYVVNSLGEGRVWVTNIDGEPTNGDYITSSPIAGHGQLQDDDILHSYTVAKLTESIDWASISTSIEYQGKSYKKYLAACTYHCG